MAGDDPTLGELRILIEGLSKRMEEAQRTALRSAADTAKAFENLQDRYITRDYFDTKMEGYADRISRVEADVKDLAAQSATARGGIQQDMKEERANIRKLIDEKVSAVQANLTALEVEQKNQEEALKAQKNIRIQALTYAIVGAVFSIISTGIIRVLFPA